MAHPPSTAAPQTDWLAASAADSPHVPALILDDGTALRYADLSAMADEVADGLRADRRRPGPLVLRARRDIDTIATLWGCLRAGVVPMPVDPDVDPRRHRGVEDRWSRFGPDREHAHAAAHHTWILTSGSTGEGRPVVLTHGNVAASVAASNARLGNGPDDRWLLALPLHHVGGLAILWRSAAAGGTVVVQARFDASTAAGAMATGDVTIASLVPTMLARIVESGPTSYEGTRAALLGGAAAPTGLVERAIEAGLPVLTSYGMTETCSQVATVVPGEERASVGTAGRVLDGFAVTIERDGVAVGSGEEGEIVVDGAAVSPGYALEPPRHGPLHTGDLGLFDADGRLVVLGRMDRMILTGGEKVSPTVVEDAILSHPAVAAAAVVGVPDDEWGELVAAVIVPGAGFDRAAVERDLRGRLGRHELPRRWITVDELPLLPNGKVDRAALAAGAEPS